MVDIVDKINEKMGWNKKPAGWNLKSMRKFAQTLTDKDPDEKGFFTTCTQRLSKHFAEPERICASLKDSLLGTTKWRGKRGNQNKDKE